MGGGISSGSSTSWSADKTGDKFLQYKDLFCDNGINGEDTRTSLNENEIAELLDFLGIKNVAHRIKLGRALVDTFK